MAVNLSPVFGVAGQLFDNNGNPLAGGKIYTYSAGTTTPAATYTSASGAIAHSNPIVLDGAGRVPSGEIWLTDGIQYKFVVEDAASNLIGTYDNLSGINSNFVNFTNEQEIQTATAGQTVFNLATMQYQPGTNSLSVFVDGVNQYGPGAQYAYVETDSDTITFVSGLHVGASVKFTTSQLNSSGAVDAAQVSYDPPFVDSVATNVEVKLSEFVSVADFGAIGDGVTDDTVAFQAAYDDVVAGGTIYIPPGNYLVSSLTGTKQVLWMSFGALNNSGTAPITLPGVVETFFEKRKLIRRTITAGDDYSVLDVQRSTSHTGGTPGFVNTAVRASIQINPGVTDFEWALLGVVDNYSASGEPTGVYGQGIRRAGAGPAWGGVFEFRDETGLAAPTVGCVALETDVWANGFDVNNRRVNHDIVIGRPTGTHAGGAGCEVAWGSRITAKNLDPAEGRVKKGYSVELNFDCGFDTSAGTAAVSGVAYRSAAGQKWSLTAINDRYFVYGTGGKFQYFNGGVTPAFEVSDANVFEMFTKLMFDAYGDYADDAAAAAAGVPIKGVYRTGSVLKIRVS